ncbi:hypothetical protein GYMLUDRAFT_62322 [Collybiopsis luxurians FD-317 M1]|uniref:Uncharacterized protein n=1 Tax=Collybiopsis luxurians FD-317 M1 TaxID=944289 RepID=A0A0D0CL82_9AGAR|nr:hypothetical protein GYMLUDRAFT_62322 [Collybiopsis luxurians FD-317 M1]
MGLKTQETQDKQGNTEDEDPVPPYPENEQEFQQQQQAIMNSIQEQQLGEEDRSSLTILQDNQQQEILLEEVPVEIREWLKHAMHAPAAPSADTSRELHEINSHTSKILPDESLSKKINNSLPILGENKAEIAANLIAQKKNEQDEYSKLSSQGRSISQARGIPRKMMMRDIPPHMSHQPGNIRDINPVNPFQRDNHPGVGPSTINQAPHWVPSYPNIPGKGKQCETVEIVTGGGGPPEEPPSGPPPPPSPSDDSDSVSDSEDSKSIKKKSDKSTEEIEPILTGDESENSKKKEVPEELDNTPVLQIQDPIFLREDEYEEYLKEKQAGDTNISGNNTVKRDLEKCCDTEATSNNIGITSLSPSSHKLPSKQENPDTKLSQDIDTQNNIMIQNPTDNNIKLNEC